MIIGLDFDGTVVTHSYPSIGHDIGAFPWLREALALGAQFILHTMRSGIQLLKAHDHLELNGIKLLNVNANEAQKSWTDSPKVYCHLYVDDAALGIPLHSPAPGVRPCVYWPQAGPMMLARVREWFDQ